MPFLRFLDQSLVKSKKDRQNDFIVKMVCENPGISAKGIHDRMPTDLHKQQMLTLYLS